VATTRTSPAPSRNGTAIDDGPCFECTLEELGDHDDAA